MKDTHTLRTFYDGCELTLRYDDDDTAHFELWIPGEATPEPLATLPADGGALEWTPSAADLLEHYDEGKEEMIPVSYAEDIRAILEDFAALAGDRRRYTWNKKWCAWEVSDENEPLVIVRDGEQLGIITPRNDRKAGFLGWRIHWNGEEPDAYREIGARLAGGVYHYEEEPAVYFLVETSSQQYSEEYGEPTYGTQVWRIEGEEVTHDAWFACGPSDPATAVKKLCDVYVVAGAVPIYRVFLCYEHELTRAAIPPVDKDLLRVVRAIDSMYCYLVF